MATVLVYEDEMHRRVLGKIFEFTNIDQSEFVDVSHRGKDYIDNNLVKYAQASQRVKVVLLRDLDQDFPCAPSLLSGLLVGSAARYHPDNFIFRVAVREVEAWFVADKAHFGEFFRINPNLLNTVIPEAMVKPKSEMLQLIMRGRLGSRMKARFAQVGTAPIYPAAGYNQAMSEFVEGWSVERAIRESNSLRRAVDSIKAKLS